MGGTGRGQEAGGWGARMCHVCPGCGITLRAVPVIMVVHVMFISLAGRSCLAAAAAAAAATAAAAAAAMDNAHMILSATGSRKAPNAVTNSICAAHTNTHKHTYRSAEVASGCVAKEFVAPGNAQGQAQHTGCKAGGLSMHRAAHYVHADSIHAMEEVTRLCRCRRRPAGHFAASRPQPTAWMPPWWLLVAPLPPSPRQHAAVLLKCHM
jgi:hypothetical protein